MDMKEAIRKAIGIKKHGGIGKINVGLSKYPKDHLYKTIKKSNELIERLNGL